MDLSNDVVVHVKSNGMEYLQFRRLLEYKDIVTHAYSLGIDKNFRTSTTNNTDFNNAVNEYKKLCGELDLNYINLVKTNQTHSDEVKVIQEKVNEDKPDFNLKEYAKTDGLVTNKSNLILASTNADCILFLLFDPVKKVISNVHSGWRGTLQRIVTNAIRKMCDNFGSNVEDIIVCICPSIRKCHFEVDAEVKDLFKNEFKDIDLSEIIEIKENEKWNIDTVEINKAILQNMGIKPENIVDSGICSVCNSSLVHSFRKEGKEYKLSTAIIGLK